MARHRRDWRGDQNKRAKKRLDAIELSIVALADEDLLDLADIFIGSPTTPMLEIATAEMIRRGISL